MGNELIAKYYINGKSYDVYGCWDKETAEGKFAFYDVYDFEGNCINEGDPFYKEPHREDVKEIIEENLLFKR